MTLCGLYEESFSLRPFNFFIEDLYRFLFWKAGSGLVERKEGRDEKKRMLFGRMEGAHSRGKWFVALHRGFQIISFSCPTTHSHPLMRIVDESTVFHCHTSIFFLTFRELFESLTFSGPLAFEKKSLWIYAILIF